MEKSKYATATRRSSAWITILATLTLQSCGGGGSGLDSDLCPGVTAGSQVGGAIVTRVEHISRSDMAPAYCKVSATIAPQTAFELRLPDAWQHRYMHMGGGGFDGTITYYDDNYLGALTALSRGFAVVASNGGHVGRPTTVGGPISDASWALDNPALLADYGYRAIGTVDTAAKAITTKFYGRAPQHSYFNGCSTGGREALIAATHFPQNYDGILAGAPETSNSGKLLARYNIYRQVLNHGNILPSSKVAALERATLAACDGLDGVNDGLISNPAACHVDPAVLRCTGADNGSCLTDAQVQTVRTIRGDTALADGTIVHAGFGLGAEFNPVDGVDYWQSRFFGNPSTGAVSGIFWDTQSRLRYFTFNDPSYELGSFQADRDYPLVASKNAANGLDVDPNAFKAYAAAGKKLIIWNGASDYGISVNQTIRFYRQMSDAIGGATQASAFSRLFVLPGVQHCGGGVGADQFDQISAISDWVEKGTAPQSLNATKIVPSTGAVQLSRPLCPYPQF
ncbi:MAG: tannase/feruloyl esterase family alpha/beta hydrolase, partial [Pseudomonadota bacterium]